MLHGAPNMELFDKEIWKQDNLPEVHFDDTLWGFMIQMSEKFWICIPGEYGDDVLFQLLCMGVTGKTIGVTKQQQQCGM